MSTSATPPRGLLLPYALLLVLPVALRRLAACRFGSWELESFFAFGVSRSTWRLFLSSKHVLVADEPVHQWLKASTEDRATTTAPVQQNLTWLPALGRPSLASTPPKPPIPAQTL